MQETVEQYVERILGNVSGEPLAMQENTPGILQKLVANAAKDKLTSRPSPEAWSVAEILAHLVDAELVAGYRIRKIVNEPGTDIQAYDQNAWAANSRYAAKDPAQSLREFLALREMNLKFLRSLTPEQLERHGNHSERGRETVEQVARMIAGHDVNHVKQIEKILRSNF
jgi:uncharacterized damage-inducible protein DinB